MDNYIMLTHNLDFSLAGDTSKFCGISQYNIRVKPLTNISPLGPGGRSTIFIGHEPTTTDTLKDYQSSVSQSVGANIGFFGTTPTGGIDVSSSVSASISMHQTNVSCEDHCTPTEIAYSFILNDQAKNKLTYQFQLVHLAVVPDEGLSNIREQANEKAQKISFSLEFDAVAKIDVKDMNWIKTVLPTQVGLSQMPRHFQQVSH